MAEEKGRIDSKAPQKKKISMAAKKAEEQRVRDVTFATSQKEGICTDDTCPRHGLLRTRGRIFEGKVVSTKTRKTAVVEIQFLRSVPKYERYEKRKTKLHVHIPDCYKINEGDTIKFMECRKLSKTKAFVIID